LAARFGGRVAADAIDDKPLVDDRRSSPSSHAGIGLALAVAAAAAFAFTRGVHQC
jgi:hypothetical protein